MTNKAALIGTARKAAENAYAPYTGFRVGAAVSVGDKVYFGANVENASVGLTICAERAAIFAAITAGARKIDAIAISCIDARPSESPGMLMPCGACRQVIAEFGDGKTPVHIDGAETRTISELMPNPFVLGRMSTLK